MGAVIYIPSLNHYSELPDSYTQLPSDTTQFRHFSDITNLTCLKLNS